MRQMSINNFPHTRNVAHKLPALKECLIHGVVKRYLVLVGAVQ